MTIKDLKYVKINSIYPLYLIIHKVNRYFEKINKTKYQTLSFLLTRAKKKMKIMINSGAKLDI